MMLLSIGMVVTNSPPHQPLQQPHRGCVAQNSSPLGTGRGLLEVGRASKRVSKTTEKSSEKSYIGSSFLGRSNELSSGKEFEAGLRASTLQCRPGCELVRHSSWLFDALQGRGLSS